MPTETTPTEWLTSTPYNSLTGQSRGDHTLTPPIILPTSPFSPSLSELHPASYGLDEMNSLFPTEGIVHGYPQEEATLSDIIQYLKDLYCGTLTLESAHMMVKREEHSCVADHSMAILVVLSLFWTPLEKREA